MNWSISQVIHKIAYCFRVLQFLLMAYLIIGFIYWVLTVGKFIFALFFAPIYVPVVNIVNGFAKIINWNVGERFPMLHPEIFFALVVIFIALFISNVLFVVLGEIEKKFVEKSYDNGEKDYK